MSVIRFPLFLAALALTGCASMQTAPTPNSSAAVLLTRVSPEAALDSVAALAASLDDLEAVREGDAVLLRDTRPDQYNAAIVSARSLGDGFSEVVVRSEYVVTNARSFEDIPARIVSPGVFEAPTSGYDWFARSFSGEDVCGHEQSWRNASPPEPRTTPRDTTVEIVESAPVLIGGMAGLGRRLRYPETMRKAGIQGKVKVTFIVSKEGEIECARVISAPHADFAEAALAAVRESVFEPGTQRGEPVNVRFTMPLAFLLR